MSDPGLPMPKDWVPDRERRIRDLEREVERLKAETVRQGDLIRALIAGAEVERLQSVVDGWTSAEAFNGWIADRADAERLRWLVERHSRLHRFGSRIDWHSKGYDDLGDEIGVILSGVGTHETPNDVSDIGQVWTDSHRGQVHTNAIRALIDAGRAKEGE